jgi:hypothetical protein
MSTQKIEQHIQIFKRLTNRTHHIINIYIYIYILSHSPEKYKTKRNVRWKTRKSYWRSLGKPKQYTKYTKKQPKKTQIKDHNA